MSFVPLSIRQTYSPEEAEVRTVLGEAGNQGYTGQLAVANVYDNRNNFGGFPSNLQPSQFNGFNTTASVTSPAYDHALDAVQDSHDGVNVVGNATYFANPSGSTASWALNLNSGNSVQIGQHYFTDNTNGTPYTTANIADAGNSNYGNGYSISYADGGTGYQSGVQNNAIAQDAIGNSSSGLTASTGLSYSNLGDTQIGNTPGNTVDSSTAANQAAIGNTSTDANSYFNTLSPDNTTGISSTASSSFSSAGQSAGGGSNTGASDMYTAGIPEALAGFANQEQQNQSSQNKAIADASKGITQGLSQAASSIASTGNALEKNIFTRGTVVLLGIVIVIAALFMFVKDRPGFQAVARKIPIPA